MTDCAVTCAAVRSDVARKHSRSRVDCTRGLYEARWVRMEVRTYPCGPVAQLGARLNGIQEVTGSIPVRSKINPGASPPDPLLALSLGAAPPPSVREARSLRSLALSVRFAPGPPTRSLARRCAASLRSRGSLAALARVVGSLRPRTPYSLSRSALRRLPPFARLARCARSRCRFASPPDPLLALSLGAAPPPSVREARSLRSLALSVRFAPGPPTRSLARRCAASLRSRGSLAALARVVGSLRPRTPYSLSRSALRRLPPFARLARCARSRCRFASPPDPLLALSLGAAPPPSVREARSLRSLA